MNQYSAMLPCLNSAGIVADSQDPSEQADHKKPGIIEIDGNSEDSSNGDRVAEHIVTMHRLLLTSHQTGGLRRNTGQRPTASHESCNQQLGSAAGR